MNSWRIKRISKGRRKPPLNDSEKTDRQWIDFRKNAEQVIDLLRLNELKPYFGRSE